MLTENGQSWIQTATVIHCCSQVWRGSLGGTWRGGTTSTRNYRTGGWYYIVSLILIYIPFNTALRTDKANEHRMLN